MRSEVMASARCCALGLLLLSGCRALPPVAYAPNDGFQHLPFGGTFECDGKPTEFVGNRKDVTLKTECRSVWIAGSNNTVIVYVPPGASIELTGSHNDVVYRLTRRGAAPAWIDRGLDNRLMRNSTASWERDHDWYEEQH